MKREGTETGERACRLSCSGGTWERRKWEDWIDPSAGLRQPHQADWTSPSKDCRQQRPTSGIYGVLQEPCYAQPVMGAAGPQRLSMCTEHTQQSSRLLVHHWRLSISVVVINQSLFKAALSHFESNRYDFWVTFSLGVKFIKTGRLGLVQS